MGELGIVNHPIWKMGFADTITIYSNRRLEKKSRLLELFNWFTKNRLGFVVHRMIISS